MDVPHIIAGRFRIECEIGRGGMGTVYRATHLGLERPVAVKIIKTEFASDPHATDRFLREARTMARLRHPHAAMIFDAGCLPDGRHFIVMEYVEGSTLSETLSREGRFNPERAVRIASDICDVLAEAHGLGIIHRDLKPSNIILNERGVCVLDFGVAKVLATTSKDISQTHAATTGSGAIVGTPRYMSPEQCMGQRVEARSDLYSLGVLLYEMLAGRPPFVDALASAVLVKQATSQPVPLTALREDVPRPLALAIHALLAKQPENRPRSAVAARSLLEKSIAPRPPERVLPEVSPLATTISTVGAGLGAGRCLIFRALTPAMMIVVLGVVLFVWGSSGQSMMQTASLESGSNQVASRDSLATGAGTPVKLPQALSLDEARRVVAASAHGGEVADVRVVRRGGGSAILAIHDERRDGTTHLFMMERAGARYRVTGRAALDANDFRGAIWTAESVDADSDGSDEVIYTGTNARGMSAPEYRLVLYVPRTRRSYAMRITMGQQNEKTWHARWSSNALKPEAALYRTALQQHARTLVQ